MKNKKFKKTSSSTKQPHNLTKSKKRKLE